MTSHQKESFGQRPTPDTGNASNAGPQLNPDTGASQLIDKKGEKYLRESANIEDLPDPQEEEKTDENHPGAGAE